MNIILSKIIQDTGLSASTINRIVSDAPKSYKTFFIPKQSGGKREISQPTSELKIIQRSFVNTFLSDFRIHSSATAYRKGTSIRDNALPHAGHRPTMKLDFKNFFQSITFENWRSFCLKHGIDDMRLILYSGNILFRQYGRGRGLRLSIGAPSSPVASNILMHRFDEIVSEKCNCEDIVYTRYADDLTFSARRNGYLNSVKKIVLDTINIIYYPNLEINNKKTVKATTKYGRYVTGLTLSNDGGVSIGRKKKRLIRSKLDHAKKGVLSAEDLEALHGDLAFIKSVDPEFFEKIFNKEKELVSSILRKMPRRKFRIDSLADTNG